ncbi:MAG: hypothetical protein ACOCV2_09550, partial [Persicimonas sp.]
MDRLIEVGAFVSIIAFVSLLGAGLWSYVGGSATMLDGSKEEAKASKGQRAVDRIALSLEARDTF